MKFNFMFIPPSMWYTNVRSEFTQDTWDLIRKCVYKRDSQCCLCGSTKRLEAHEDFIIKKSQFILRKIVTVCNTCHRAIHIKRCEDYIEIEEIKKHLAKNNVISKRDFNKKLKKYLSIRHNKKLKLNLSYVFKLALEYNIPLKTQYKEIRFLYNKRYKKALDQREEG